MVQYRMRGHIQSPGDVDQESDAGLLEPVGDALRLLDARRRQRIGRLGDGFGGEAYGARDRLRDLARSRPPGAREPARRSGSHGSPQSRSTFRAGDNLSAGRETANARWNRAAVRVRVSSRRRMIAASSGIVADRSAAVTVSGP